MAWQYGHSYASNLAEFFLCSCGLARCNFVGRRLVGFQCLGFGCGRGVCSFVCWLLCVLLDAPRRFVFDLLHARRFLFAVCVFFAESLRRLLARLLHLLICGVFVLACHASVVWRASRVCICCTFVSRSVRGVVSSKVRSVLASDAFCKWSMSSFLGVGKLCIHGLCFECGAILFYAEIFFLEMVPTEITSLCFFARQAHSVEAAVGFLVLCGELCGSAPTETHGALPRFAFFDVASDAFFAYSFVVAALPLGYGVFVLALLDEALCAWFFFHILCSQCFPIDLFSSPNSQE